MMPHGFLGSLLKILNVNIKVVCYRALIKYERLLLFIDSVSHLFLKVNLKLNKRAHKLSQL